MPLELPTSLVFRIAYTGVPISVAATFSGIFADQGATGLGAEVQGETLVDFDPLPAVGGGLVSVASGVLLFDPDGDFDALAEGATAQATFTTLATSGRILNLTFVVSGAVTPVLSAFNLSQSALSATTAVGSVVTTSGSGTIHLVGVARPALDYLTDATPPATPTVAQVLAGQDASGSAAAASATVSVSGAGSIPITTIAGLALDTVYWWFAVHQSGTGVASAVKLLDTPQNALGCYTNVETLIGSGGVFLCPYFGSVMYQGLDTSSALAEADGDPVGMIFDTITGTFKAVATSLNDRATLRVFADGRIALEAAGGSRLYADVVNYADNVGNRFMAKGIAYQRTGAGNALLESAPLGQTMSQLVGGWRLDGNLDNARVWQSRGTFAGRDSAPVVAGEVTTVVSNQIRNNIGADARIEIYVNGGPDSSVSEVAASTASDAWTPSGFYMLGRANGAESFTGAVFGVFVTDRALTVDERRNLGVLLMALSGVGATPLPLPTLFTPREGDYTSSAISEDGTQATIVTTLPAGAWSPLGHTLDASKVGIYARKRGYGRITATLASTTRVGGQMTVTLNLSRTVNSGEVVALETLPGWFVDARGNFAAGTRNPLRTYTDMVNGSTVAPPATSTGASWGRLSIEIANPRAISFSVEGLPVLGVSGDGVNEIVGRWPEQLSSPIRNGLVKNSYLSGSTADPLSGRWQGFDARESPTFQAAKVVSLPSTFAEDDMYLMQLHNVNSTSSVAFPDGGTPFREIRTEEFAAFYFSDTPMSLNELFPAFTRTSPSGSRLKGWTINAAARVLDLPSLTRFSAPPISDLAYYLGRLNVCDSWHQNESGRRRITTFGLTRTDNFGRDRAQVVNAALCALIADYPAASKEELALWVAHHGFQLAGGWGSPNSELALGGAFNQGYSGLVEAAMWLCERDAELTAGTIIAGFGGNELRQGFAWQSGELQYLQPHNGNLPGDLNRKFSLSRRRTISSVSGNQIFIGGLSSPVYFHRTDCRLTRESDGAFATVTGEDRNSAWVSINQQPNPPFAAGEVVYFGATFTISAGDYDWDIRNERGYSPSRDGYRELQQWVGVALFILAVPGVNQTGAWDAVVGYVARTYLPNFPPGQDWAPHSDGFIGTTGTIYPFPAAMYTNHAATFA